MTFSIDTLEVGKEYIIDSTQWGPDWADDPSPFWHGAKVRITSIRHSEVCVEVTACLGAKAEPGTATTISFDNGLRKHGLVEIFIPTTPEEIAATISKLRIIADDLSLTDSGGTNV